MRKNRIILLLLAVVFAGSFVACDKNGDVPDPDNDNKTQATEITKKVNNFIFEAMDYYYLWYNQMPDIDYNYETDSKEYFYNLLYDEEDKWSYITDDIDALLNSFQGIEKTYGWSLAFGEFFDNTGAGTGSYFAVVEFVYPNTPAATAGIKRGDIIMAINGGDITQENYTLLLYGENLTFTMGEYTSNGMSEGSTVTLSALELNLNPVVKTSLINYSGKKIGYLFYAQYIDKYNSALDTAFQSLHNQGAEEIILDLRYNPGGQISAAQHLSSILAPKDAVSEEKILVTFRWNDKRQKDYEEGQIMDDIQANFDKQVPLNLNLSRLYVLTGSGTASASELTITGLEPYMNNNVITVGDTTYGKYTASITLRPTPQFPNYDDIKNWGLQPIVLRYANAYGVTDFKNGFAPDILVEDDLLDAYPLGDLNDKLVKAAVEDIIGTPVKSAMKSARKPLPDYRIFDRGFSRFDSNKRELLIDTPNKEYIKSGGIK